MCEEWLLLELVVCSCLLISIKRVRENKHIIFVYPKLKQVLAESIKLIMYITQTNARIKY